MLDVLETHLAAPEFLDKIEAARASTTQGVELTPSHNAGPQPSRPSAPPGDAPAPAEPADDYVMIDQEDAVQSLAYYIAQCLVRCPEAQKLKPEELQTALCTSFKVSPRCVESS